MSQRRCVRYSNRQPPKNAPLKADHLVVLQVEFGDRESIIGCRHIIALNNQCDDKIARNPVIAKVDPD